jgi:hypothetical protein
LAPNCSAQSRRAGVGSIATIAVGEYSRAPKIAASPTGPAPTMATVSPGWTWPLSTPIP